MNSNLGFRRRISRTLALLACLGLVSATAVAQGPAPHEPSHPEPLPPGPRVAVLMYHHLSATPASGGTMTPALFREHLETLRRLAIPVISLSDLAAFLEGRGELPAESVALTFDDGYESFFTQVYPLLKAYRMPAAVFVIVRPTAHPETASPSLPHLKWEQLSEMLASGLVTAGAHSYDLHQFVPLPDGKQGPALVTREFLPGPARGETVDEYETRVLGDFSEANRLLDERLGVKPGFFAFPYGRFDPWLVRLCRLSGYRYLFTTRAGLVTRATDPLAIPRFGTGGQIWTEARFEEFLRTVFKTGRVPVFGKEPPPPEPSVPGGVAQTR